MKNPLLSYLLVLLLLSGILACTQQNGASQPKREAEKPRLLVFSKTAGFRHKSIPHGKAALLRLGQEHGVRVDTTENAAYFVADSLRQYQAVVFLNTTQDVLNPEQQAAFENYIRSGGGFAGIHAASDTEFDWPWYANLVGAQFDNHPKVQHAAIDVVDKVHPATRMLPDRWERRDEWYNFKNLNLDVQVLATLDETTYEGGKNGNNHPIAWFHTYDGGRAFYTALGHTPESYSEPLFLQHLWGGITYAMGL
ncbi:ThuA domain-containing protein [Pontibacter roseus]|uniref:ThuA domain-containing protein n=1 Tax=Pontibacter roseus TaxID=336989 RepID=UPI00039CB51B|nr:ThuA domain-containing protein [Pontibacter roseus]